MVVVLGVFLFRVISIDISGLLTDFEPKFSGRVGAFSCA